MAIKKSVVLPKAAVVQREDITSDLFVIKFKTEETFSFKPGQYATLGVNGIERAYSIVSAPHEPLLEVFVELVPPPLGQLTPLLKNLIPGDSVTIRPRAKGIFTMDDKYNNHLMIATVTGIAPFLSILRSYIHEGRTGHKFFVLQGASYRDEFVYNEEMEDLALRYSDFICYVPTISRPSEERNSSWTGESGRVNVIVEKYISQFRLQSSSTLAYVCGHPGMIEDVKQRLTGEEFKVKEERFWKE